MFLVKFFLSTSQKKKFASSLHDWLAITISSSFLGEVISFEDCVAKMNLNGLITYRTSKQPKNTIEILSTCL